MSEPPILLFLHGVGDGDQNDDWRETLDRSLTSVGYPSLDDVTVIAPKYPMSLHGVDDDDPLPTVTVKEPRGEEARSNRRNFERRRTAMEILLGADDEGGAVPGIDGLAAVAAKLELFVQAKNYAEQRRVRAAVLRRVLRELPSSGQLVVVGHSLGSVIAADLVRRVPERLDIMGMVTIGSPLSQRGFDVPDLRSMLKEPPTNMSWWINFWSAADPVTTFRGISPVFPWVLDYRLREPQFTNPLTAHSATSYLTSPIVARTVGRALFGSQSKEIVRAGVGVELALDEPEKVALLALRYAHLTADELEGERQERYRLALRTVQAATFDQFRRRSEATARPLRRAISELDVDLSDPESVPPLPELPGDLAISDAVVPLCVIAMGNVLRPFEIDVDKDERRRAMERLALAMGLGTKLGEKVFEAVDEARRVLRGPTNWVKWTALGLGTAAVIVATGGLALAAAPGAAGAAAITSALAAFGPGGMIGGLMTAGTLVGAGGGGVAFGLAAAGTTAEAAEAMVAAQLTTAILRGKLRLDQDPQTWHDLVDAERQVTREIARLRPVSDQSAPTLKELDRKLDAINRALDHMRKCGFEPESPASYQ